MVLDLWECLDVYRNRNLDSKWLFEHNWMCHFKQVIYWKRSCCTEFFGFNYKKRFIRMISMNFIDKFLLAALNITYVNNLWKVLNVNFLPLTSTTYINLFSSCSQSWWLFSAWYLHSSHPLLFFLNMIWYIFHYNIFLTEKSESINILIKIHDFIFI